MSYSNWFHSMFRSGLSCKNLCVFVVVCICRVQYCTKIEVLPTNNNNIARVDVGHIYPFTWYICPNSTLLKLRLQLTTRLSILPRLVGVLYRFRSSPTGVIESHRNLLMLLLYIKFIYSNIK